MLRRNVTSRLTSPVQNTAWESTAEAQAEAAGQEGSIHPPLQADLSTTQTDPSTSSSSSSLSFSGNMHTTVKCSDTMEEEKCPDNMSSDLGCPRSKSVLSIRLSARSLMWENTASTTEEHQPPGCGNQHQQISLNSRFMPDPERLRNKNNAKLSGQYTSLHPEQPRPIHPMSNTGCALWNNTRKIWRPMRNFTWDGRIPCCKASNTGSHAASGFGKRASVLPLSCSFGWQYTRRNFNHTLKVYHLNKLDFFFN